MLSINMRTRAQDLSNQLLTGRADSLRSHADKNKKRLNGTQDSYLNRAYFIDKI
jgi:hypothetical protein